MSPHELPGAAFGILVLKMTPVVLTWAVPEEEGHAAWGWASHKGS